MNWQTKWLNLSVVAILVSFAQRHGMINYHRRGNQSHGVIFWRQCINLTLMVWFSLLTTNSKSHASNDLIDPEVTKYLQQYCYGCHGENLQKGDRRFDSIPPRISVGDDAIDLLEEVLDAINRGDMPPRERSVVQPTAEETRTVVAVLTQLLVELNQANASQTTVMRRLNRFEYVNTMRDLLGLNREYFDVTSDFPVDATEHGFDNNGEALILSDHQLQRYLEVAKSAIDTATFFGVDQPISKSWSYRGVDFNGVSAYQRAPVTWRLIVDEDYLEIGHGQPSERHPNFVKSFARDGGVPNEGWYLITLKAAAANRLDHGYQHQEFDRFTKEKLKLALWIAPEAALLEKNAADQRRLVKVWDLPDGEPEELTQRVWLEKGAIPFVSWTNGISSKGNIRRVAERYHPEVIRATQTQLDAAALGDPQAKTLVDQLKENEGNALLSEVYRGPRVRIWEMKIEGPDVEQWPPQSHQILYGRSTEEAVLDTEQTLQKFARRAFRQPIEEHEIEHYVDFTEQRIELGDSIGEAIKLSMAAMLTSPRFLYLDEGNDEENSRLNSYELASRLSYFLWSSMPDAQLINAAESGKLTTLEQIESHVLRMLNDERSEAFVEHFTDTWLGINTLGSMPPDPKAFEAYYRNRLEDLFKKETRLYFSELLQTNHSILNLIQSDYTFVNDTLAAHYGIDGVEGERFRKVTLEPKHRRGGLLGQGSVLTLSANGIETSPIVRGVWVLEKILGTPPPAPPADVPAIEPDTRGTTSVRDQLAKHRTVEACSDCHSRIDPVGFALEFYDPIGAFRETYPMRGQKGILIDGSGRLPSGESFTNEGDLKQLLIQRKDRVTQALTEKLMSYATGRTMTFQDQGEINAIASRVAETGYGLRDLIIAITKSSVFATR